MNELHTVLQGGPSDGTVVPTADFVQGRNTVMVATDTHTTCPATSLGDPPLRPSALGTRPAVYEQAASDAGIAQFVGWADELAQERDEASPATTPPAGNSR